MQGMAIIVFNVERDRNSKQYAQIFNGTESVKAIFSQVCFTLRLLFYPRENNYELIVNIKSR